MAQAVIKSILLCFITHTLCGVNGKNVDIAELVKVDPEIRVYGELRRSNNPNKNWEESLSFLGEQFQNSNFSEAIQGRNEMTLSNNKGRRFLYGETEDTNRENGWKAFFDRVGTHTGTRSVRNQRFRKERRHSQGRMHDDYISNRSFLLPVEERYTTQRKKSHVFRNRYNLRPSLFSDPFAASHSVRMFKRLKKKLHRSRIEENHQISDIMNVQTTNDVIRTPKWQYKCKVGTSGVLGVKNGRMVSSRGLTYSEDDGNGIKSLLCRAETSEMLKPDEDTLIQNSVTGLNVVTTDYDPFRFLERGNEINNDILEIGSKAVSALESLSNKNKSGSVVSTQDRDAESHSRVSTKFIFEKSARTAFESKADVEGSTRFNITDGQIPLVLTGKQESSSIIQKTRENFSEEKHDNTVTFMNYKKKTDFDIAFRNLFDY